MAPGSAWGMRCAGWWAWASRFLTLGLGFLLVLVDDRRQGLADKLGGTLVLYAGESGLATGTQPGGIAHIDVRAP